MKRIIITGALGQIGTELTFKLMEKYGEENVLPTDILESNSGDVISKHLKILDVRDIESMKKIVEEFKPDTILHMAAILSATCEKNPQVAWDINMGGLVNALEVARIHKLKFFTPSSIGAFGPTTPKINTPQSTIQRPNTMYGVNKVSGELLCDYYYIKFGVDTRGLRFPGLISHVKEPGGGTTDYAVEMYFEAVKSGKYTSFLDKGTCLDMMYMEDAIDAIIQLMEADGKELKNRNAFNISAMSVTPEMVANEIRKHIGDFSLYYKVDPVRQGIADSWPNAIDCFEAKRQWGFAPRYNLELMTEVMLEAINNKKSLIKA
ncbi:NAD-dependent epimerase/dehydratase family protein [Virgibacillus halodenitrificans]|uniref:NAD-dependent epimerase/dehydratase family protein n=1 Tax=Virgibacillus halodenitrificans TaxID=1482 RepID=UPI00045C704B|nr:NAD-dependent epimerase/dehydratase family protein [Virgibacillus halodenitrificans]MEC2159741.1 NAD-dependent epimerase/dehydratase family protein [Virgibacillus halodenitrificans]CDQ31384.1 putative epimerase/dehydratase [Virgibacillus halodenitrificans]